MESSICDLTTSGSSALILQLPIFQYSRRTFNQTLTKAFRFKLFQKFQMADVDSLSEVSSFKSFRTDIYGSNPELGRRMWASSVERKEAEGQVKALETRIQKLRNE
jgi:hypothetical protein